MSTLVNLKMDTNVNELIEEMVNDKEAIVRIDGIAKHLKSQGVMVEVHIGRIRPKFQLTAKMFGVKLDDNKELKEFFETHVNSGTISFLPMGKGQYGSMLQNIEVSVRTKRNSYAIGFGNSFMPIALYKEFKEYFKEKKFEYLKLRDDIVSDWDVILRNFNYRLNKALSTMAPDDAEMLKAQVALLIPKKEDYYNSFYMNLDLTVLPIAENLDIISDDEVVRDLEDEKNSHVLKSVYNITGNVLNHAFSIACRAYSTIDNLKSENMPYKTSNMLKGASSEIKVRNIVHNEKLNEIAEMFDMLSAKLLKSGNFDMELMNLEIIASHLYGYACEIGVKDQIEFEKKAFDEQSLIELYEEKAKMVA